MQQTCKVIITIVLFAFFCTCPLTVMAVDKKVEQGAKATEKQKAGARIQFEHKDHDFGKSLQDSALKHTFNFKNVGNEVLIIEKVKAG